MSKAALLIGLNYKNPYVGPESLQLFQTDNVHPVANQVLRSVNDQQEYSHGYDELPDGTAINIDGVLNPDLAVQHFDSSTELGSKQGWGLTTLAAQDLNALNDLNNCNNCTQVKAKLKLVLGYQSDNIHVLVDEKWGGEEVRNPNLLPTLANIESKLLQLAEEGHTEIFLYMAGETFTFTNTSGKNEAAFVPHDSMDAKWFTKNGMDNAVTEDENGTKTVAVGLLSRLSEDYGNNGLITSYW